MVAKKNTAKKPALKKAAKPAAKAPTRSAKTGVSAKTVKKAAPARKPAPAKKPVPAKKQAPVKKSSPAKKPAPVKKQAAPLKKAAPAKKAAAVKKSAPLAKAPVTKAAPPVKAAPKPFTKPAPVLPPKPPFVPPKAVMPPQSSAAANGTHSPSFISKQRQRLLDLRDDLVDSMSGMTRDTIRNAPEGSEASGSGQHQGDAGSDAYDRDFALSVLAKEQDALYEIEQALRRIQSGSYGICEISSRKIPQARLEAIPFARLTVECQAQWEKEYGKRRFRPSNEVGFSGGNYVEDEDSDTVSLDEDED
jgi:RNA polymerase-binding transcription factor DksA